MFVFWFSFASTCQVTGKTVYDMTYNVLSGTLNFQPTIQPSHSSFCYTASLAFTSISQSNIVYSGLNSEKPLLGPLVVGAGTVMPSLHRRHGQDKTVLSCPCRRCDCERNWWLLATENFKTVLSSYEMRWGLVANSVFTTNKTRQSFCSQSHSRHGQDETKQSCLVRVGGVNQALMHLYAYCPARLYVTLHHVLLNGKLNEWQQICFSLLRKVATISTDVTRLFQISEQVLQNWQLYPTSPCSLVWL